MENRNEEEGEKGLDDDDLWKVQQKFEEDSQDGDNRTGEALQ